MTFVNVKIEKLKYFGKKDLTDVPAIKWKGVKGKVLTPKIEIVI